MSRLSKRSRPNPQRADMRKLRAIDAALKVSIAPSASHRLRSEPLPDDVFDLIRISAGCEETCRAAAIATGRRPEVIRDAAVHFLHLVLFAPGASSRRILGADDGASRDVLLRNKRWLLKWLHPDRNSNVWEARYLDRVLKAWNDVSSQVDFEPAERIIPMGEVVSQAPSTPTPTQRPRPSDAAYGGRDRMRVALERAAPPPKDYRSAKIFAASAMFVAVATLGLLVLADMIEPFENLWNDKPAQEADASPPVEPATELIPWRPAGAKAARDAAMTIRKLWPTTNRDD